MKKFLVLTVVLFMAVACDKVKNPRENTGEEDIVSNPTCTITPHVVKTNTATNNYRKVLVEDYTGHTCGNCPNAARKIEQLHVTYGDSMVVLAVHSGNAFAKPVPPHFPEDFRNPAGEAWQQFFLMNSFPQVSVNHAQTPYAQSYNALTTLIPANLNMPQTAKLDLTTTLDTNAMLIDINVKTYFLAAMTKTVYLTVVLTEDSILANQEDYNPPASANLDPVDGFTIDYRFDHVLRKSFNGSWGVKIKEGSIAANDTIRTIYKCQPISTFKGPKKYLKHLSVVAFIYDNATKEVLQAEKVHILD